MINPLFYLYEGSNMEINNNILCRDKEEAKRVLDEIGFDKVDDWEFLENGAILIKLNRPIDESDMMDRYESLMEAVIIQAVSDYWEYHPQRRHVLNQCKRREADKIFNSAAHFFDSPNLIKFTSIPKDVLLSEESVYAEKYKDY